ncbi:MAG: peptidoglycan-binding protein [Dermatophilaceae bacterium]
MQPQQPAAIQPQGSPPAGAGAATGSRAGAGSGPPDGGQAAAGEQPEPAPVLTGLAAVGSRLGDGAVAYAANGEPTVVMVDDVPSYRVLREGDSGADIQALEQLLERLGRADGVTVDDEFTSATADAVEDWEADLGRADPDGVVELGDLLVVSESQEVTGAVADIGDEVPAGTPLLDVGAGVSDAVVDVAVDDLAGWAVGADAQIEIADQDLAGKVRRVGRDAVDGRVEVRLEIGDTVEAVPGTPLDATVTADLRSGAVTVPVAALVSGSDGATVVRTVAGSGTDAADREVEVTVGLVVDGLVEVTGVDEGAQVRVPD